jgi:sterol desaturase/sphingolipid hydroxylase (fatty acid hydroxylase superfamily)
MSNHVFFIIIFTIAYIAQSFINLGIFNLIQLKMIKREKFPKEDLVSNKFKIKKSIFSLIFMALFSYVFFVFFKENLKIVNTDFSFMQISIKIIIILFLNDLWFYFIHRWILHNKFLYKYIHKQHHESKNPNIYSTYFVSISEMILHGVFLLSVPFFIEVNIEMFILGPIISSMIQASNHSNYNLFENNKFFMSPIFHRKHHQVNKGNYGQILQIWDKILGTCVKEEK